MKLFSALICWVVVVATTTIGTVDSRAAFVVHQSRLTTLTSCRADASSSPSQESEHVPDELNNDRRRSASRRDFLTWSTTTVAATAGVTILFPEQNAQAVGPVKIALTPTSYQAEVCPPDKPIPGEKAMLGMRGLCVTVNADMKEPPPKDLEKVGVYGFITDGNTGDSVLANNPDLSTDAGQFAMIEEVTTKDKKVSFEFIAAVPKDRDLSKFDNGIGPLDFSSLRLISFPGGQQYGAINPCEMNEFSDECEAWEAENGPYEKGEFMVRSNPRTKGR